MEKLKFTKTSDANKFYLDLKNQVYEKLGTGRKNWGPDVHFWSNAIFWFISCWGTYYLILTGTIHNWWIVPATLIIHLSGLLLGFNIGHDAAHEVISKSTLINRTLHFLSFLSIGIDPNLWGLRHIRSHHIYPNVEGSDIDIDKNPLLRLSPTHPWQPKHRYQHLYAPFAYSIALVHSVFWGDWIYLFHRDYEWMRKGVSRFDLLGNFFLFKLLHFTLMIALSILHS